MIKYTLRNYSLHVITILICLAIIIIPTLRDEPLSSITVKTIKRPAPPSLVPPLTPFANINEAISTPKHTPLKAWTLNMGVFADEAEAQTLLTNLRTQKWNSFIQTETVEQHQHFKVLVGPITNLEAAETIQHQLKEKFNINTILIETFTAIKENSL